MSNGLQKSVVDNTVSQKDKDCEANITTHTLPVTNAQSEKATPGLLQSSQENSNNAQVEHNNDNTVSSTMPTELRANGPRPSVSSWSTYLHYIAAIAALVFGAWAIKSYDATQYANNLSANSLDVSTYANRMAQLANQLVLPSLCN